MTRRKAYGAVPVDGAGVEAPPPGTVDPSRVFERILVDLSSIQVPSGPDAGPFTKLIVPINRSVYGLQVRSLTTSMFPLNVFLRFGAGGPFWRLRGQGDQVYFRSPETTGIFLVVLPLTRVGAIVQQLTQFGFLEVMVSYAPFVEFPSVSSSDPWALVPTFTTSLSATPIAGEAAHLQLQAVDTGSNSDAPVVKVTRLQLFSTIAGTFTMAYRISAAAGGAANLLKLENPTPAGIVSTSLGIAFHDVTALYGSQLFTYDVQAGITADIDGLDIEILPASAAANRNALMVNGPVGAGTMKATFFFKERTAQTGKSLQ